MPRFAPRPLAPLVLVPLLAVSAAIPASAQQNRAPATDSLSRGQQLAEQGKLVESERAFRQILELGGEPAEQARIALASVLLARGRDTEVRDLLADVLAGEGDDAVLRARGILCRVAGGIPSRGSVPELAMERLNARLRALYPRAALMVAEGVTRPEILSRVQPQYTQEARDAKLSGVVVLESVIDEQGRVSVQHVLQGQPMGLTEAAQEAVESWTFRPATAPDGQPVAACYSLTVNFQVQ